MRSIRLPNFIIIGAPRSGTTALYKTIRQHPEIYMSPIKEPMFFAFSQEKYHFEPGMAAIFRHTVRNPQQYLLLFAAATNQRAIGEASNIYLRTPWAAQRIHATLPTCQLIAVLRNPVERAYSHYSYMARLGLDRAPDFGEALRLERTEPENRDPFFLYTKMGYYAAQLQVYFELFPRERIRIFLYEDWNDTPRAMLKDLFGFLEVDDTVTPELQRFIPPYKLCPPPPLTAEQSASLTELYRTDILRLQDMLGRDLSHWLDTGGSR